MLVEAQPALTVVEQPDSVTLNESVTLVFDVAWQGDPGEFVTLAPSLELESWAEVEAIETASLPADDGGSFRHTITIVPTELGQHTTPALKFPYLAKADLPVTPPPSPESEFTAPEYEYLEAGAFTITVREPSDSTLVLMSLIVLACAMFGSAFVFYRRNAVRIATAPEGVSQTVPSYIHEARKHRLDEDHYQFFQTLVHGVSLLHDSEEKHRLHRRFTDQAMAVGYKGAEVTEDELDGALRDLERAHADDRHRGHSD